MVTRGRGATSAQAQCRRVSAATTRIVAPRRPRQLLALARLRQLNLDLMVPRPEQIVVLQEQREPAPQSPMVGTEPIRTASR